MQTRDSFPAGYCCQKEEKHLHAPSCLRPTVPDSPAHPTDAGMRSVQQPQTTQLPVKKEKGTGKTRLKCIPRWELRCVTLAELPGLAGQFSQTRESVRGLSPTLQPDGEAELLLPQFPQSSDGTNSKSEALCLPSLEVLTAR